MRLIYQDVARDGNGLILSGAEVSVTLADTSASATIYSTLTGTTPAGTVTSGSDGVFSFFVDASDYGTDQAYNLSITYDTFSSGTISNIKPIPVLGSYSITSAKTYAKHVEIPRGVTFVQGGGGSLSFTGQLSAGTYQIFSGFSAGSITISTGHAIPEWFGATGNGSSDDAVAIDAAVSSLATNGGTVSLRDGATYILGTLSADANSHSSYITPKDGVSIIGKATLKVKSGENARFSSSNAPNIIATGQVGLLKNCEFRGFTVDWNGANNLLTALMTVRNNASILTMNGGENILCKNLIIKDTPGAQCIFIKNDSFNSSPGTNVIISECSFIDSGSGLSSNYNTDHSSVYLISNDSTIENCIFSASQTVTGTCYEFHGNNMKASGNKAHYYSNGFYIASDTEAIEGFIVDGDTFYNCYTAFGISAQTYDIDNIFVRNSKFYQDTGLTFGSDSFFAVGSFTISGCNRLDIQGCEFVGQGYDNVTFLFHNNINDLIVQGNTIRNFKGTGSFGIRSANTDLGTGYVIDNCIIHGNNFIDVGFPVYFNAPTLNAASVVISNNSLSRTAADSNAAFTFNFAASLGRLSNNVISSNYSTVYAGTSNGLSIDFNGTYVPVVSGGTSAGTGTYTTQVGRYVVKDNLCTVYGTVVWTAHTGTGDFRVSIPMTAKGTANQFSIFPALLSDFTFTGGSNVVGYIAPNVQYANLAEYANGGSFANLAIDTAGSLYFTSTYEIN